MGHLVVPGLSPARGGHRGHAARHGAPLRCGAVQREVEHVTVPPMTGLGIRASISNDITTRLYATAAETRERLTFVAHHRGDARAPTGGQGPISVSTSASGLREMSGTRAFFDG